MSNCKTPRVGADQLCTSYNFARKSVKWWRKLFFWLLEICIVNSYPIQCRKVSSGRTACWVSEVQVPADDAVGWWHPKSTKAQRSSIDEGQGRATKSQTTFLGSRWQQTQRLCSVQSQRQERRSRDNCLLLQDLLAKSRTSSNQMFWTVSHCYWLQVGWCEFWLMWYTFILLQNQKT